MNRGTVVRFAILVFTEIVFIAILNFCDDWTFQQMPVRFVGTAVAAGIAFLAAVSHFPSQNALRNQAIVFWAIALLLRLIVLPVAPSDDLVRYQWEGKVQRAGFNPYITAPADPQLDDLRHSFPEAAKINHPELRAFAGPGAELFFRFLNRLSDKPLIYKIIFGIGDLGVAAVLLRLIGGEERYSVAAWYAWNPLVVYSFAGAAHFDSLMIVSLVAAVLALDRLASDSDLTRQWVWAGFAALFLGIAISFHVAAAALLLLFVFALRWRSILLLISVSLPALLSVPFGSARVVFWDSLGQIRNLSRLNDLCWWLIEDTFWPNPHQRNFHYLPIIMVSIIAVSILFVRNWKRGILWALGIVLALTPILQPWFCTWILPIAAWRRSYAWHVLSVTLFAYYLFWDERLFALPWHAEPWMRALIIAPVLASMIMLAAKGKPTAVEVSRVV